jgi:hypothetical protein
MSKKSKAGEDFESMEIEEIDVLIENAEGEMKSAINAKKSLLKKKSLTKKALDVKLEPIEEALT